MKTIIYPVLTQIFDFRSYFTILRCCVQEMQDLQPQFLAEIEAKPVPIKVLHFLFFF